MVKCDTRYVDETKTVHIKCDRRVAKVLVDKLVQVQDKSPASKAVVRLRCELTGTNNEAHIMLVNNGATKNLIKSIGRLELTERIKGNSGTDFFPVDTLFSQTLKVGEIKVPSVSSIFAQGPRYGHFLNFLVFPFA